VAVPEELGGAGMDYVSLALVLEEIAAGDGGTSTIISVNNCPVCSIAMMYANAQQKNNGCGHWRKARCWAPSV
jgi:alkylation response protein AidB-like acyl-CoA dehydrogenase